MQGFAIFGQPESEKDKGYFMGIALCNAAVAYAVEAKLNGEQIMQWLTKFSFSIAASPYTHGQPPVKEHYDKGLARLTKEIEKVGRVAEIAWQAYVKEAAEEAKKSGGAK